MSTEIMNLVPVDEFTNVIQAAPEALRINEASVSKCVAYGQSLIEKIDQAGGMTDEFDAECNTFLVKARVTVENIYKRRKPLTEMFDKVRTVFTELEKQVSPKEKNSIYSTLQLMRNEYATLKAEEQKKREEAARLQLAKSNERADLVAAIDKRLSLLFSDQIVAEKKDIYQAFEGITLSSYDAITSTITHWSDSYKHEAFTVIKGLAALNHRSSWHSKEDIEAIIADLCKGKFPAFSENYKSQIAAYKEEVAILFTSKKNELEAAKAKADEAEVLRKEAEVKADSEKLILLQKEKEQREVDLKIQQEKRLADEEVKVKAQAAKNIQAEESRIEMDKQINNANSLFDAELTISEGPEAKAIESYEIEVKNPAAWVLIFTFYFQREGSKESVESLGKKSLNQMKAFAEKHFKKTEEKIDSPYIEYKPVYKVAARKS